jgi:hypothetical protein
MSQNKKLVLHHGRGREEDGHGDDVLPVVRARDRWERRMSDKFEVSRHISSRE